MSSAEAIKGAAENFGRLYHSGRIELPAMELVQYGDDLEALFASVYSCDNDCDVRWELGEVAEKELLWRMLARHMRGEHVRRFALDDLKLSPDGRSFFLQAQAYQAMSSYLFRNNRDATGTKNAPPTEDEVIKGSATWLGYHPELPPAFTIATREFYAGFAASLALVYATHLRSAVPTWMRDEFARAYAIGSYSVFRLLTGVAGDQIPQALVPDEDRIHPAEVLRAHERFVSWSDDLARDVAASGEAKLGTYFSS